MSYLVSFIFGVAFGSFISVLVWRIKNKEKGIFFGRSQCPKCKHILGVFDLVPIFSYIFLGGKCRYCGNKISIIYPILEVVTGLTFVFITYLLLGTSDIDVFLNNLPLIVYGWLVGIFFVALAFYDILFYEISFVLAGILGILLLLPQLFGWVGNFLQAVIFGVSGFIIFLLISFLRLKVRKIEGLGGGDAIGAALIGFLIPVLIQVMGLYQYPGWIVFYLVLMFGFLIAGIVGLFGLITKKFSFLSKIPFLPFMFLGIVLFVFVGKYVLAWLFSG